MHDECLLCVRDGCDQDFGVSKLWGRENCKMEMRGFKPTVGTSSTTRSPRATRGPDEGTLSRFHAIACGGHTWGLGGPADGIDYLFLIRRTTAVLQCLGRWITRTDNLPWLRHEYSFVHTILSVLLAQGNIQPSLCGTRTVGELENA